MTVGSRIKILRKQRKMTLKELGAQTGLSSSFLCDVEQGRTKPSLNRLNEIACALETSVAYLMGEDCFSDRLPLWVQETSRLLLDSNLGIQILQELTNFNEWTLEDQQELLHYLNAKELLRNTKTGA